MLYARWCLQDVERVEELEARFLRIDDQMRTPFSKEGAQNLNRAHRSVMAEIDRAPGESRRAPTITPDEYVAKMQAHAAAYTGPKNRRVN